MSDNPTESDKSTSKRGLALEEERRRHDKLCNDFNDLRARVLAFITGELALVAYLFSTGVKIPHIIYGLFFFMIGVLSIIASFIILLFLLKAVLWMQPVHPDALKNADSYSTDEAFLKYLCDAYSEANKQNQRKNISRVKLFDKSLILLLNGVIILLVIKFGQGVILWNNFIKM